MAGAACRGRDASPLGILLMLAALLLVLLTVALSHWLVEPLVLLATPLLTLSWFGWALLAGGLWLFAGGRR